MGGPEPEPELLSVRADFLIPTGELSRVQAGLERLFGEIGATATHVAVGPLPESPLDRQLNGSLATFMEHVVPHVHPGRTLTQEQGLRTVRDLFLLGANKLKLVHRVGELVIDQVRQKLVAAKIPLELKDEPSMADIAVLCTRLDQIPLQTIAPEMLQNRQFTGGLRFTVKDALSKTALFRQFTFPVPRETIHQRATVFDSEFTQARERN